MSNKEQLLFPFMYEVYDWRYTSIEMDTSDIEIIVGLPAITGMPAEFVEPSKVVEWFGWAEFGFANLDNRVVIEPPEEEDGVTHEA
jgi:hypothetical protein